MLFGGTFDPVHNGHVAMAEAASQALAPQRIVALPAGNPYQRGQPPNAAAKHRTAMLALAMRSVPQVEIDTRELERNGPTYTVDTLREWRAAIGNTVPLVWLLGGDAFSRLDTWHDWRSLFALAHFAVIPRQQEPDPRTAASAALQRELKGRDSAASALGESSAGRVAVLTASVPAISSTDIRARLNKGVSIRGLVPDAVCDYIEQHKLYLPKEQA